MAFLHESGHGLDEKDEVLAAVLRHVDQDRGRQSLPVSLLWLGLWPGLSVVLQRCLKRFKGSPDDLVSDLVVAFTRLVRRRSNARLTRVAAGLVRGTERLLTDAAERERDRQPQTESETSVDVQSRVETMGWKEWSQRLSSPSLSEVLEVAANDAELVLRAFILGEDHNELARHLGIRPANARKRIERARKNLAERLSHFDSRHRVSPFETSSARGD